MLFKRYKSKGLAHYSYLIGDKGEAVVIDPRRDIGAYLKDGEQAGFHIGASLETHRNEDYLIGSCELEAAIGTVPYHADREMEYQYGHAVQEGQTWQVGEFKIEAIHSPGHTPGMMNYLLYDPHGEPWMVFSGDTLFAGGVGRVDLFGEERMDDLAGQLYDSIFEKLLPLGEGVLLCPAHGAGSVCGSAISERTWTTIGLEKRINPALQVGSREEFIEKNASMLERPPYFRKMEKLNLAGPPVLGRLPMLQPLQPDAFEEAAKKGQVVDTRGEIAYGGAHLPGSLSIWEAGLPAYAGWYLDYDRPILIVTEAEDTRPIVRMLIRIGFDRLAGALKEGVLTWAKAGKPLETIGTLSARELCETIKEDTDALILDVRGEEEIKDDGLEHGLQIHATVLSRHLDRIPKDRPIILVCPSGLRSMFAASYLKKEGWRDLNVLIGGLEGWESFNCDAVL